MSPRKSRLHEEDRKSDRAALLAVFPSRDAYQEFKEDDPAVARRAGPLFVRYARSRGLIAEEREDALLDFIEQNRSGEEKRSPPKGFTFGELVEEITENSSVNSLINWLNGVARDFELLEVQASMFSRLRKDFHPNTSKKRNLLRLLAFWLGMNRSELGWNYEMLLDLPRETPQEDAPPEEKEGVRIAFSLQSRGNIIDFDAVQWLRTELPKCIKDLKLYHVNWRQIAYTATTAALSLPKMKGPSGEPRLYSQAIRDSLALAHQISVRWRLSEHSNQQRSVVIGIAAGPFAMLDTALQALLATRLPGNLEIRVTDFARLCARVAEVKVGFHEPPKEVEIIDGRLLTVWPITSFWSFLYYDFIPELLEDEMLPTTHASRSEFENALYFYEVENDTRYRALRAIHQFPQNTLLALEIAKVCIARRMFHEANSVLSTILASNPRHLVTRTLRMSIFRHLMMERSDPSASTLFFERAREEARLIESYCEHDEESLCETGLLYFARAVQFLTALRSRRKGVPSVAGGTKEDVFLLLEEAERCFARGTAVSPSAGLRPFPWQMHIRALTALLKENERFFDGKRPFVDHANIYRRTCLEFMSMLGWIGPTELEVSRDQMDVVVKRLLTTVHTYTYSRSVLLRNYIPFIKYFFAVTIWDFAPVMTVRLARTILNWLEEAIAEAQALDHHRIGVYAVVGSLSQIQSARQFVACTEKTIRTVQEIMGDDLMQEEHVVLDDPKRFGQKMLLLHIDEKVDPKF
jgi:hypothetical protein